MFSGEPGSELLVDEALGFPSLHEFLLEVELALAVVLDAREDLLLVLVLHHPLLQVPLVSLALLGLVTNENLVSSASKQTNFRQALASYWVCTMF